ncbi:MAG: transcriptional repressor [Clostridia bacterium]
METKKIKQNGNIVEAGASRQQTQGNLAKNDKSIQNIAKDKQPNNKVVNVINAQDVDKTKEIKTRNTPQRKLIRSLLQDNFTHPTADEVYELARQKNAKISRGTVYRNLNLMAESGEIERLQAPFGADHYDFQTKNHYHFLCRKCYRVLDAPLPYADEINLNNINVNGCKCDGYKLILLGLCPNCNKETE